VSVLFSLIDAGLAFGAHPLLDGAAFTLTAGERLGLIGRNGTGKSSLLNNLLREDKAIVTDIEGTTRDVIEEYVNIKGVPLKLIDTAGIRETDDLVEQIGVERSKKALQEADLVLLVLNASEPLTDQDRQLLEISQDSNRIVLLNKTDLEEKIELDQLPTDVIKISVLHNQNIDKIAVVCPGFSADCLFSTASNSGASNSSVNLRNNPPSIGPVSSSPKTNSTSV